MSAGQQLALTNTAAANSSAAAGAASSGKPARTGQMTVVRVLKRSPVAHLFEFDQSKCIDRLRRYRSSVCTTAFWFKLYYILFGSPYFWDTLFFGGKMEVHWRNCRLVNFFSCRVGMKFYLQKRTKKFVCNVRLKERVIAITWKVFYLNKQRHDIMAGKEGRSLYLQIGIPVVIALTSRTCLFYMCLCFFWLCFLITTWAHWIVMSIPDKPSFC